ncbi:MAG: hypothetical protein KF884_03155 [Fimbriimonadaceae bacterium]|nr:hypothetical protein [Fimbriimonadaceae bacterium]QYK59093.1 MAG: hypothetical protein KF884_03155 [Fimbriimonadaceae bacterium]
MIVVPLLVLTEVLLAQEPKQEESRTVLLRVLVHNSDEEAKQLLRDLGDEATKTLAHKLGYEVFRSPSSIIFLPKPVWSSDATSILQSLLDKTRANVGAKVASNDLEPAERPQLLRFLRSTQVGGELGSQMRASTMKQVSVDREVELTFRRGDVVVKIPVPAEKLAWAFANPTAEPDPVFGYSGLSDQIASPGKPTTSQDREPRPNPLDRPQLYGLMTEGFSVSNSRPLPPSEFNGFVDFVQDRIEERRKDRMLKLKGMIESEFQLLFPSGAGRNLIEGSDVFFDQLPKAVQHLLAKQVKGHMKQLGTVADEKQPADALKELSKFQVSSGSSGRRVFVSFHVTTLSGSGSPLERWVGFTFEDIASQSP